MNARVTCFLNTTNFGDVILLVLEAKGQIFVVIFNLMKEKQQIL